MTKLLKQYDYQIRDGSLFYDTDRFEDELDYLWESRNVPILNMMIGLPRCGKSTYTEQNGLVGFMVPGISERSSKKYMELEERTINIISDSNLPSWRQLKRMIKNKESVVWDCENLTRKEREKILKRFPDSYRKVAIVWDLSDEELKNRGCSDEQLQEGRKVYERPDGNEGIDEFVYILS